jgi:predicted phage tail protein
MLTKIRLHGALGQEFQEVYELQIETAAEAIRALCCQVQGFRQYFEKGAYRLVIGNKSSGRSIDEGAVHERIASGCFEIHLIPRVAGSKDDVVGKIVLGVALVVASFVVPGLGFAVGEAFGMAYSTTLMSLGTAMVLGGVSMAMMPRPEALEEQERSNLFGGPVNTAAAGAAIPVVVGEIEVGSIVVSASMHIEDRASGSFE